MQRKRYLIKYQTPYDPTTWLEWKTVASTETLAIERFNRHCVKHHITFTDMNITLE